MAKQRYINTKFWSDPFVQDLTQEEKLLYLYLLTNEHTNILGIYEISFKTISFESGYDLDTVSKALDRLSKANKVHFKFGIVIVTNFLKYQSLNPKVIKGIEREFAELSQNIKAYIQSTDSLCIAYHSLSHLNLNFNLNLNTSVKEKSFTPKIKLMEEEYTLEELSYETVGSAKSKYGQKTMAILARKFAEVVGIEITQTFDASEWAKPLGAIYKRFNKDPDKTMKFFEDAGKWYNEKGLTFTPHTLEKNFTMLNEKWLKTANDHRYE